MPDDRGAAGTDPVFRDIVVDPSNYRTLPYPVLLEKAADGDEEAEEELRRRDRISVLGPLADDTTPVAEASGEVLMKRMLAGDEEAEAEYKRRLPPRTP